jgi:hypothetical protein
MTSRHKIPRGVSPYMSVGRCIYCRSTEPPLTIEHIIADGLGGTDILRAASCEECREKTRRFEEAVLRGPIWALRRMQGVGSRVSEIDAQGIDESGKPFRERRPRTDVVMQGALPVFRYPPGQFGGVMNDGAAALEAIYLFHDRSKRPQPHAAGSTLHLPLTEFSLMVAKMAHGTAVKAYTLDGFIPFTTQYIRGLDNNWPRVVGKPSYPVTFSPPDNETDTWVHVFHDETRGYVVGHVRLFGRGAHTPVYEVAIGQRWGAGPPHRR